MAAPNTVARDMNVMAERKGHADDVNIPGEAMRVPKIRRSFEKSRPGITMDSRKSVTWSYAPSRAVDMP